MEKLIKYLEDNLIFYSIRKSIKISITGERDTSRRTVCLGTISDREISEILDIFNAKKEIKKYILRRTNDSTSFIIGLNEKSVRFYIDNGLDYNRAGMISVEIENNSWNVKSYKKHVYKGQLDEYFYDLTPYLDIDSFLIRSDGQMYFRVIKQIPREILNYYCRNEPFFDEVNDPVWFQFSDNSFTFYFKA